MRKQNSGRKAPLKDLEKDLYEYFLELRKLGRPVNNHILRKRMMSLNAEDQEIEVYELELAKKFQKSVNALQTNISIEEKNVFSLKEAQDLREVMLRLGKQVFFFIEPKMATELQEQIQNKVSKDNT